MLFGHNTDVKVGDTIYHVQTEDRGAPGALIDTAVYQSGRVLHRCTTNYLDLLPMGAENEGVLRKRIDDQHRGIIEQLQSGALKLAAPAASVADKGTKPKARAAAGHDVTSGAARVASADALVLELRNPKTWLAGRHAKLQVLVRNKQNGLAAQGVRVAALIDGSIYAAAPSGPEGQAQLEFEMPATDAGEPVMMIEATQGEAKGQLKFVMRNKKVPTA